MKKNASSSEPIDISVVIPVKDEVDSVAPLAQAAMSALAALGRPHEIVFVDDGSSDGTAEKLREICRHHLEIRAIILRRNFGKALALQAGFDQSTGELILTMDGDLQDDPAEMPRFLQEIAKGADLVSGWKIDRQDPLAKRWLSKIFNFVVCRASGVALHDFNCGYKCYRREIIREINLYGEMHRFVPVFAHARGYKVVEVPVKHRPRRAGRSKYGLVRLPKGFFDFLTVMLTTRYFFRPLHYFGAVGLASFVLGTAVLAYLSALWFCGIGIGARPLFFLGLLLTILGVQIICTGLVAEMITKIGARSGMGYSIKERINSGSDPD